MKKKAIDFIDCALRIKGQYDDNHIAAYSAEAAFFMLVSAVPLAMFVIILFGALSPIDIKGLADKLSLVFSQQANQYITKLFAEIASHATVPLASVTMVFLLLAATRGIRSIADGIKVIYDCKEEYNIIQLAVRSVVYTVVMIAVLGAGLGVLVFASPLENAALKLLGKGGEYLLAVINMRNIIFFLALTLLFALAYKGLVKSSMKFKNHLPGAMVASAGWIVYSFGYSVYIKHFSSYSALYGSLGAVMLFMLWLYMCMNILLCGALLNKISADGKKCD